MISYPFVLNTKSFNIAIRSQITIAKMKLPIIIDIARIKNFQEKEFIYYDIDLNNKKNTDIEYVVTYDSSPFKRYYDNSNIELLAKRLYKYLDVDIKSESGKSIISLYGILSEDDFIFFIKNMKATYAIDIDNALTKISLLESKVQNMFLERIIELFEVTKEYPKIELSKDSTSKIEEDHRRFMMYGAGMLEFQSISEYPMGVWFNENIGKAYTEWSWREIQAKQLYLTSKNRTEEFIELVKSKLSEPKTNM